MMLKKGYLKINCLLMLFCFIAGCVEIQHGTLDAILRSAQDATSPALDEWTVAAGLKEALRVGSDQAVVATSKLDGFLANALIRIMIPEELNSMASTLRSIGLGRQVDKLEVAMNRAAELAAGEAKDIFWAAISKITIEDAFAILNGGKTAATDYFRRHSEDTLRKRFHPIISVKMEEVELYQIYNRLITRYNALPFVSKPAFNLDEYVTEKALIGLFTVLGQEEKRIREDPTARTTELLRRVFAS